MNILVLGGDLRYLEVIDNLSVKNNVDVVGYKNTYINDKVNCINIDDICISKYDSIIFPVNGVMDNNIISCRFNNTSIKLNDDFLAGCRKDCLIFSGISTPNLDKLLDNASMDCIYLMKDKEVIRSNSIPTAEGIIADIVLNTEITIDKSNILIFGYGNIGKVLVKYLNMLGANVTVSIIEPDDKNFLDSIGINCFYSNNTDILIKEIGSNDVIVNTVPNTVIDSSLIKYINRSSYVLDVASHPHGVDREVLDEFFIKNKLYLGIPGKVAPKTSGKILSKKINQVMGD